MSIPSSCTSEGGSGWRGAGAVVRAEPNTVTGEMRAQALPRELGHGLTALAGGGLDSSGEVGLDLQPQQSFSTKRMGHDVAAPKTLRSQNFGSHI